MDLDRTPSQIANAVAEEIRALNHRTLNTKAFDGQPGNVSDTAIAIATLLERLPQALQQLEAGLIQMEDGNRIRLDTKPLNETSRADIRHEVFTVTNALSETRRLLREAHIEIREATGALSHMGGMFDDDGDGE